MSRDPQISLNNDNMQCSSYNPTTNLQQLQREELLKDRLKYPNQ